MKELIKQYLDQGLSRRQLVSGLSAVGMSTVAAKAVAQNLAPFGQGGAPASGQAVAPTAIREVEGNGGKLFVEQLKSAGVEYIFFNPSTGDHPIFDALVDVPEIKLIKGIQEGAVTAMADGYARASRRTGVVVVANIGLPNAMTQMVNTLQGPDPDAGRRRVDRSERARPRSMAGDRPSRADDRADHQMVLAGAVDGSDCRDHAARTQIRLDPAMRAGVPVACQPTRSDSTARRNLGAKQIRRADAHSPRQGGCRESGAHADRGQEPAAERRRRSHLVPRREGAGRAGRTPWRAGRRRVRIARLLVEAVPDAPSAVHRHGAARQCASPASPTFCSISAIAGASSRRRAPN